MNAPLLYIFLPPKLLYSPATCPIEEAILSRWDFDLSFELPTVTILIEVSKPGLLILFSIASKALPETEYLALSELLSCFLVSEINFPPAFCQSDSAGEIKI